MKGKKLKMTITNSVQKNQIGIVLSTLLLLAHCGDSSTFKSTEMESKHEERVMSLTWSPDGTHLASVGFDGTVRIWDAATGRQERVLTGSSRYMLSAAWSPTGVLLMSVSNDAVQVFNTQTGHEVKFVQTNPPQPPDAAPAYGPNKVMGVWSPDGQYLALYGWSDGNVWILDVATGAEMITLEGHANEVSSAAWSPNGKYLATAGWDNTVRMWDIEIWEEKQTIQDFPTGSLHICWSPDGKSLSVYVALKPDIRIIEAETGNRQIFHTGADVANSNWQPNGKKIALGLSDGSIQIWDITEKKLLRSLRRGRFIDEVAWSSNGDFLAAVPFDATRVSVWNINTQSTVDMKRHRGGVMSMAWHPNEPWLASGGHDGIVRLHKLKQ
jgi:WD40 repeat protein